MKYKLYIDFDGVVWDTWPMLYKVLEENAKDLYDKLINKKLTPEEDLQIGKVFLKHCDWDLIMKNTNPIIGSLEALKELYESNIFDMSILTHCNTDSEVKNKCKIINEHVPGVEVIPVFKPTSKAVAVNPDGAILIDDYSVNLEEWEKAGGIGVKFSLKECDSDFYHIKSLIDIIKIINEIEYKKFENNKLLELDAVAA